MDIYGYPAYQYSQSDELAKQLFAQQALSQVVPYNRDIPEPHVMPPPSGAPWNMQGLPWGLSSPPQLVHFTAQNGGTETKMSPVIHCKRKSLDIEPAIPAKQLITEEKMAAHMNSLHISSDYKPHAPNTTNDEFMDVGMETAGMSDLSSKLKGHKIVLSDELKKLQEEPLLPAALIERLEKPQMSLVVWKPRENILTKLKEVDEDKEDSSESHNGETKRRNGLLVTELTGMDVEM